MIARLVLPAGAADALARHAAEDAPREACGLLIGSVDGDTCTVVEVRRGRNTAASNDLYELDPEDFVAADAHAEARGLSVVGFYHSHPRGPERLSHIDEAKAWPGSVYLLIHPPTRSGSRLSAWIAPGFHGLTVVS